MKEQIRGKAEELKGRFTGNRALELKGRARQAVANVKRGMQRTFRGESERHREERGRQQLW